MCHCISLFRAARIFIHQQLVPLVLLAAKTGQSARRNRLRTTHTYKIEKKFKFKYLTGLTAILYFL